MESKKRLDGLDGYQPNNIPKEKEIKNTNSIRDININKKSQSDDYRFVNSHLKNKKTKKSFFKKIIVILVLLSILVSILTYFFYSADFEIKYKESDIDFTNNIYKANIIKPEIGKEIPFKLINIEFDIEKDLKSVMVEDVKKQAVGKIKIINSTSKVQKLRKETRFEVDGKIFKTYKSVTIPAKSAIVRDAFSDLPGELFNLKKGLKMVIPGFKEVKDMDSYKKITGEIAEDFDGGFIGKKDIADKKDLLKKKEEIEEELKTAALINLKKKIPEGYILNTDGIFTDIRFDTVKKDDNLKLIGKINTKGIIFDEKEFLSIVSGLTKDRINEYNITSTAFLKFKILNKENISSENIKTFNFELNGKIRYIHNFNKDIFINLVRNKNVEELEKLFDNKYNDFNIKYSVFPFWMLTVPNNKELIKIELVK